VFFANCLRQRYAIEVSGQHDIGEDEVNRRSGGEQVEGRIRIVDSDGAVVELGRLALDECSVSQLGDGLL
jgi:hypothetical protein